MSKQFSHDISRRHFLAATGRATAAGLLAPRGLFAWTQAGSTAEKVSTPGLVEQARREAANATVTVQRLRGNVSVLMGAGGNIAVLAGPDGKLLIDAGYAGAGPKVANALAGVSSDPIKHLINTHWHFDHTDGNDWIHSAGASILAHENTRRHLSTATRVDGWAFTFAAAPAGAIPTAVFTDQRAIQVNGEKIELKHYGPAHTDSDIYVHFSNADIIHVADTFWNGYYPFIDYSTGGSIDGMIRATEQNLSRITDNMIVIPGHGAIATKSDLSFYRDMLVTARDKVAALKKQGKSLDEVIAAKPTADYDAKWGAGFMSPRMFTGLVFEGV